MCAFGHVTRESEEFRGETRKIVGGGVYFFSIAIKRLGANIKVVTKLNENDNDLLSDFQKLKMPVVVLKSSTTTKFHTVYGKTLDERFIKVFSIAEPFSYNELNYCNKPKYIYIGPLTINDFNLDFLMVASQRAKVILDVQGFTRKVENGKISYVDWSWKDLGLKYVHIFKADEKEAKLLTGESPEDVIRTLTSKGAREVIVTSLKGVRVGTIDEQYFVPFIVKEIKGRVGRGDTCTAAYTYAKLRGWDLKYSTIFAAAVTSIKLSYSGPFRGSLSEVMDYIDKYYKDYL